MCKFIPVLELFSSALCLCVHPHISHKHTVLLLSLYLSYHPSSLFVCLQLSPGIMNTVMKGTFNVTLNNPLGPCCSPRMAPGPLTAHKTINTVAPNTFIATRTS